MNSFGWLSWDERVNQLQFFAHVVVVSTVSSWVRTTKTMVLSSTWSTHLVSHTWVALLQLMVVVRLSPWWRNCVCVQGYWGCAIGKAKQAAKTEIEKLQVRWVINEDYWILIDCWNLLMQLCVYVSDEGDDMQRARQRGRQNVSWHPHISLNTDVCVCVRTCTQENLTDPLLISDCDITGNPRDQLIFKCIDRSF